AAALLAAAILCPGHAEALVGADLADRTIQRYTVVVGSPKGRCTGVVLAQNIVLTAAHCIVRGEKFWVGGNAGGGSRVIPPSPLSAVDGVAPHPLFSRKATGSPDLAILKLAKPLPDRFIPAVLSPPSCRRRQSDCRRLWQGVGRRDQAGCRAAHGLVA